MSRSKNECSLSAITQASIENEILPPSLLSYCPLPRNTCRNRCVCGKLNSSSLAADQSTAQLNILFDALSSSSILRTTKPYSHFALLTSKSDALHGEDINIASLWYKRYITIFSCASTLHGIMFLCLFLCLSHLSHIRTHKSTPRLTNQTKLKSILMDLIFF